MALDAHDRKILYELDINSRTPSSELSKRLRIPKETINYRINRLVKNNYINKFYALFNASLLGYTYYKVNLKFQKLTKETENRIITYLTSHPACLYLLVTEGAYDCSFLLIQKSSDDLREFMQHFFHKYGVNVMEKEINIITRTTKLNQKFLYEGKEKRYIMNHSECSYTSLDDLDYELIHFLSTNARTKLTGLARTMGVESNLLRYRIKKLEKTGVIQGYVLSLNLEKTGLEMVELNLSIANPSAIPTIIEFFDSKKRCLYAYEMVGKYDLVIELYIQNDTQLRSIVADFRERFQSDYIHYRISHVYAEYSTNWSPRLEKK